MKREWYVCMYVYMKKRVGGPVSDSYHNYINVSGRVGLSFREGDVHSISTVNSIVCARISTSVNIARLFTYRSVVSDDEMACVRYTVLLCSRNYEYLRINKDASVLF
jgi:hypothetical protein